jgi:regulator of protease activity HflC (stomatin/prohibitin superfamily)
VLNALRYNGPPVWMKGGLWKIALPVVVLGFLAMNCFYVVEPTEMAGIRRFGTVLNTQPIPPGLHFKLPFDTVDTIPVSLNQFKLDELTVYTVDNQSVTVNVSMTYRIPPDAVLKLLYGVGRPGDIDIAENLRPVVADRVLRVFARRNTIRISEEREQIANEARKEVSRAIMDLFGIQVIDLQINGIAYSPSFEQSVEAAVKAKNDAVQAENTVARMRYEGEQRKVTADAQASIEVTKAEGEAKARIARAQADKSASILEAEGQAQSIRLKGEAEAEAIAKIGGAVTANPQVVGYETAHRWNGQLSTTTLGAGGAALPVFTIGK